MKKNESNKGNVQENEVHAEEERKEVLIAPLTETFGNGDLNTLRDKINEVIARQ